MQVGRMSRAVQAHGRTRGLSTARAALRVAWLLARRPRASAPTRSPRRWARASPPPTTCSPACARRASPSAHPGGLYRLAPAFREAVADAASASRAPAPRDFSRRRRRALARTHKRAYVGGRARRRPARRRRARPARHAAAPGMDPGSARTPTRSRSARSRWRCAGPDAVERYVRAGPAPPSRRRRSRTPTGCAASSRPSGARGVALRPRGVRARLLLPGRADPRRPRPFPRPSRASR